jgi:catechol 2,3-dioxygenase-like lactoylglutathione lyase family enzyme
MNRTSAVPFEGQSRVHVGLAVRDLPRSIAFYEALFGAPPTKVRPGYAKFEPAAPPVNLTLNTVAETGRAPGVSHFGVQVQSTAAIEPFVRRLEAAGFAVTPEEQTECCYAIQDKVWAADPDGNPWEVFVVTRADSERRAPTGATCCTPTAPWTAAPAADRMAAP